MVTVLLVGRLADPIPGTETAVLLLDLATAAGVLLAYYRLIPGVILAGAGYTAAAVMVVPTVTFLLAAIPPLLAGIRGNTRTRLWTTLWYVPVVSAPQALFGGPEAVDLVILPVQNVLLFGTAWLVGDVIRRQRSEIARLDQERELAVRAERLAIARDLHDAVASANARIVMRAEQAKLRGTPDAATAADLDHILTTARQAGQDLRAMLATLRSSVDATPIDTAPAGWHITSLTDTLDACAADLRRAGFTVEVAASFDEDSLARTGRDALGKVLIEATSNVAKYADPTGPCRFLIDQDSTGIELLVISRRHPHDHRNPNDPTTSSGFGLTGARERLAAIGGELVVAPDHTEWVVRARLGR